MNFLVKFIDEEGSEQELEVEDNSITELSEDYVKEFLDMHLEGVGEPNFSEIIEFRILEKESNNIVESQ